jgi:hypothetical protein
MKRVVSWLVRVNDLFFNKFFPFFVEFGSLITKAAPPVRLGSVDLALAAKLNTTHGKRLTVLELTMRIKLLVVKNSWSQRKAAP